MSEKDHFDDETPQTLHISSVIELNLRPEQLLAQSKFSGAINIDSQLQHLNLMDCRLLQRSQCN